MSAKKSNNFLVQGSILAVASLIVRMIGLIYRIPMIRIIGNEGFGYYQYAFEVYSIALILSSYSFPLAVSKLVAVRRVNKEHKNAYRVFLSAMCFAIVVGLIATLIIFFGADFLALAISDDINVALPLRVLAPTIFVFAVMGVLRGFYQGKNSMIPTAVSQVLEQVVNAVVSVVAAYLLMKNFNLSANVAVYGAAGGTLGTFIGAFVGLLFLLFVFVLYKPILNKQMRNDTTEKRESYRDIFKLLLLTISPIILSQTVYQISGVIDGSLFGHIMATKGITTFDQEVLLKSVVGELYSRPYIKSLYGIYGKYRLLSNLPVAIATAMGAAIVISITASKARGMESAIRSKVQAAIKFNMIIAIPSAVGMGVLAAPIIQMLFPDTTDQLTANLLRLGAISIVFYALSTITTAILQGINRLRIPVINAAISLGLHIIVVFVLLKYTPLSTYSLIIGNVTFPLLVCILNWVSIEKYLNYRQEIIKTFIIPTVSAGLMGVATYFTYYGMKLWTGRNMVSTLTAIIVAIVVYLALLVFMKGVDKEELENMPKGERIIRVLRRLHLL